MTWTERIGVMSQAADLLVKFEVHAMLLIGLGLGAMVKGHTNEGAMVLGAGLTAFRASKGGGGQQ